MGFSPSCSSREACVESEKMLATSSASGPQQRMRVQTAAKSSRDLHSFTTRSIHGKPDRLQIGQEEEILDA